MASQNIVGCLETVSLPKLGVKNVLAKVDTGAYSGALHCTDIHIVRRGINLKRYLRFTPLGESDLTTETDTFLKTYIRSATGHRIRRFIIDTEIVVQGKSYPIRIGLSDRSDMKRALLMGRRFLRENNILVDVSINEELDDEGESTK
jgi:hypothetical protein